MYGDYTYRRPRTLHEHSGTATDVIHIYRRQLRRARRQGAEAMQRLKAEELEYVADFRSLRLSAAHVYKYGGRAPGLDKLPIDALTPGPDLWVILSAISADLKTHQYCPERGLPVDISKGDGSFRTIMVLGFFDRVVARSIVMYLQQRLDRRFLDSSYGFRPGIGHQHAMAAALAKTVAEGRFWWLSNDVANAFPSIPRSRLMDLVRKEAPGLADLIAKFIGGDDGRGIPQGPSLSPLLLNLYLHRNIDLPWLRRAPDMPLLRYADDLLALGKSGQEAREAFDLMAELLQPAGMGLKYTLDRAVVDVRSESVDWLGFRVQYAADAFDIRVSDRCWERLERDLRVAQAEQTPPGRIIQGVRGWLQAMGPAFECEHRQQVTDRLSSMVREVGLPIHFQRSRLIAWWEEGHDHWIRLYQAAMNRRRQGT